MDEIIHALHDKVSEICIGYDGSANDIKAVGNKKAIHLTAVSWEGYSITKNKLAASASNDWILSLDSDEVPDKNLIDAICALDLDRLPADAQFSFKRYSFFEGKMIKHGSWGNDSVRRLYNKTKTKWDNALVHESLEQNPETIYRTLNGKLLHFTADNYETFLSKAERYARLSGDKYFEQGKKATFVKRFIAPVFSFLKEYIFQAGFIDGIRGWKIAKGNAIYTFWKYKFLKEKYERKTKS